MQNKKILINKDGIKPEDYDAASRLLNKIRAGARVFGNPAEGLKQTLLNLEEQQKISDNVGPTGYLTKNKELATQISRTKAGINGETELAEYLEKLLKHSKKLDGIFAFASLSSDDVGNQEDLDYILDTDFVIVCGKSIMVLDAKNIPTNPENPIYLSEGWLKSPNGDIMELHASTFIWKKVFRINNIKYDKIDGCTVIVNKNGATIMKNREWYTSGAKPIHIQDLEDFLEEWINSLPDKTVSLKLLTEMSKTQIKKEKTNMDLSQAFKQFKI